MPKLFLFRASFSFEFEKDAPVTVRGEFVREDYEDACKSAVRAACSQHPRPLSRASSIVVCIEKLGPAVSPLTGEQLTACDS